MENESYKENVLANGKNIIQLQNPTNQSQITDDSSGILLKMSSDVEEKSKESLEDVYEKYRLVALNSSDLIAFTTADFDLIFTFANPSYKKILGYENEELLGRSGLSFIHNDDKKHIVQMLLTFLDSRKNDGLSKEKAKFTHSIDFRFLDKSGQWHFLQSTVDIANGEFLIISKDITEQKLTQAALSVSEEKYRNLYNSLRDGCASVDSQGKILECNNAFEKIIGYSIDELRSLSYEDITPMKWHPIEKRILEEQVIQRGYSDIYEKEYRHKDGKIIPVELQTYAIRNTDNRLCGFWAIVRDNTTCKQTETDLHKNEERFRLVNSTITDILYEWDIKTGSIEWFGDIDTQLGYENRAFPRTLQAFLGHVHPEDVNNVQVVATHGLKEHQKWQGEYRVISKNGETLYWCGTGIGIYDDEGNAVRIVGSVTNITKRKQVEKSLEESRQMLRLIMDTIPVRVFWKDRDSNYLGCNQSFARDAGLQSPTELIGKDDYVMGWVEQAELYRADDQLVIRSGQPKLNYTEPQTTPDGRKILLRTSKIPLRDAGKNIIGVLGTYEDITEKKRAEDALRKSEEQYRLVTENASDAIWTMDLNLTFTYFSPSNEKMTGYSTERALKLSLDELLTAESVERALQSFAAEMEIENTTQKDLSRSVTLELNEKRADGTIFPIEVRMCFLRDAQNNAVGILGITRDISERKKQERALLTSEEKFIKAFKSSPVAISITRMSNGAFLECNEAFEKLCGYTHNEIIGRSAIELNIWADINDRKYILENLEKTGAIHNHECRFLTKAGTFIVTRFSSEVIYVNQEQCFISALIDITDQKKMEDSIRESEKRYRSIVETTQDVIMLTGPDGRVSYVSPACVRVLEYNPDELVGKIPEIFYPDDIEKVHNALSSAMQGVSGSNLEYRILTKNGKTKWVSHSWSPILTENHELKCIASIVRDITESKIAEQLLRQKIEELEKYKSVTVNREVKMVDLKNEINELCKQLNQKPKYPSV
jgi:PAS domain S-box-containing protein